LDDEGDRAVADIVHEAVSEILVGRARQDGGMSRMVMLSLLSHAVLLGALFAMPASWRSTPVPREVTPMMITMSGAAGPDAGGMTPIAGRAVQVEAPSDAVPKTTTPPAATPPKMTVPDPGAKPLPKTPAKPVDKPAEKSPSRKPTVGAEVKPGSAVVDTRGAPIPFGGLSTGGGPTGGQAFTDYANFCCPAYLNQMTDLIKRNWNQNQGAAGMVQMKFTIRRDGLLSDVIVEKASASPMLDLESQRAILKTRQLPALPREFTENTLTVHLIFEYRRQ